MFHQHYTSVNVNMIGSIYTSSTIYLCIAIGKVHGVQNLMHYNIICLPVTIFASDNCFSMSSGSGGARESTVSHVVFNTSNEYFTAMNNLAHKINAYPEMVNSKY